jgi:two-component system, NarL family, response regulator DesR
VRTLKILLAEDVAMVRGALVALIELEPDLRVVAALERGDEVVPAAQAHQPDIAIIDIDLPGLDGLSAAEQLHEHMPSCPILILTNLGRAGTLRRALAAHVGGYLLKDAPAEQLATAIRDVAAGRRVIDPQLAVSTWEGDQNPLSPREHGVLRLAAEGAEPAEIAEAMNLSVGTVRNYLTAIVTKLNARNRVDAIKTAYDSGWLPLSPALSRPYPRPYLRPYPGLIPGLISGRIPGLIPGPIPGLVSGVMPARPAQARLQRGPQPVVLRPGLAELAVQAERDIGQIRAPPLQHRLLDSDPAQLRIARLLRCVPDHPSSPRLVATRAGFRACAAGVLAASR